MVLFLQPNVSDIQVVLNILHLFGEASGLKTNVQKSSAYPIHCGEDEIAIIEEHLPCEVSSFPCRYLGLPLSLKKLTRSQVQTIVDRIAKSVTWMES